MKELEDLGISLDRYGAKFRVVSSGHLREIKREIEALHGSGGIDREVYEQYLSPFRYQSPWNGSPAHSIIVIAVPQGLSVVRFDSEKRELNTIIPPTYIYREIRKNCIDALSQSFGPAVKIEKAALPLKILAVRSGLGSYGRNCLCYVPDMGSFARLEAFHVACRIDRDDWGNKTLLKECEGCARCVNNCPTGCIDGNKPAREGIKPTLDAGRCITTHNETEGDFPEYIKKHAHNAVIGCIKCQTVCPVNRPYLKRKMDLVRFTRKETDLILQNRHDSLKTLAAKLRRHDMDEYGEVLARNLKMLL
jgi:epoxyqueuosine reductase